MYTANATETPRTRGENDAAFFKDKSVRLFIFGRESEILSENYGFLDCIELRGIKPYTALRL